MVLKIKRKPKIVGLVERIKIRGKKTVATLALMDTGARSPSVDIRLASRAQLGPIIGLSKIKQASSKKKIIRPVVKAKIEIRGRKFNIEVNLQDRSHMNFPIIIGRNILSGNYIVDTNRNNKSLKRQKKK